MDVVDKVRLLLRQWRGSRTQLELSHHFGWQSNVVGHWEAGRRSPRASVALRLAEAHNRGASRMCRVLSEEDWSGRPPVTDPVGVSLLLGDIVAHRSIKGVATEIGRDEATLHRWLTGKQEPSFSDLMRVLEVLGLVHLALRALEVDGADRISATAPYLAALVIVLLCCDAYQSRPHDDEWLAVRAGALPTEVKAVLDEAARLGTIRWNGVRYDPPTEDAAFSYHQKLRPIEVDACRRHSAYLLTRFPGRSFNMLGIVDAGTVRRIEEILVRARLDILQLISHSDATGRPIHVSLKSSLLDQDPVQPGAESVEATS